MGSGVVTPPWPPGRPNQTGFEVLFGERFWFVCVCVGRCFMVLVAAVHGGGFELYWAIRTSQLRPLLGFHTWPIDVMVYHGPYGETWF